MKSAAGFRAIQKNLIIFLLERKNKKKCHLYHEFSFCKHSIDTISDQRKKIEIFPTRIDWNTSRIPSFLRKLLEKTALFKNCSSFNVPTVACYLNSQNWVFLMPGASFKLRIEKLVWHDRRSKNFSEALQLENLAHMLFSIRIG